MESTFCFDLVQCLCSSVDIVSDFKTNDYRFEPRLRKKFFNFSDWLPPLHSSSTVQCLLNDLQQKPEAKVMQILMPASLKKVAKWWGGVALV